MQAFEGHTTGKTGRSFPHTRRIRRTPEFGPPVQAIMLIPTTRIVKRESPKYKFVILALLGLINISESRNTQRV
jgi:hypothetical protein